MLIRANNQEGFTLLELMVVIAIISILAAFTAPTFIRQITKAKLVDAQNIATQKQSLIEEYILLNGHFPEQNEFDAISTDLPNDSIVSRVTVNTQQNSTIGDVTITLKNDTGIEKGQYLKYSRGDKRNWTCESDLKSSVLPPQCTSMAGLN